MGESFRQIPGSITAARGFRAAAVFCGIKQLGAGKNAAKKYDLAVIVSDCPATVAGMFTTNQVAAAPVQVSVLRAQQTFARAIVANSGNANACTGAQGLKDARSMAAGVARALGLSENSVLPASTGRIGVPLPMPRIQRGIARACRILAAGPETDGAVAQAIMTSDTAPKSAAVEFAAGGRTARLGAVCKGAGMIQPGMSPYGRRPASAPLRATMLCFITTDAAIESAALKGSLRRAVAQSFNRISVDGDMSTNDSVLLLANGQAGNRMITARHRADLARFQEALDWVTLDLAKKVVRDGEGASRFVTLHVRGARNAVEADAAARAVANSALVKTSWCGGDPNWGRILDALGYSAARVVEARTSLAYRRPGGPAVFAIKNGCPLLGGRARLKAIVAAPEFEVRIDLGLGRGEASFYAADLTEAYVDFNKGE